MPGERTSEAVTELLAILLALMIVPALIAVETKHLLSSILCLGAVGFLVAIAFLLLGAPDIAITQMVVEVLSLIILIRATIERDLTPVSGEREFFGMIATSVMVIVVALAGVHALRAFPEFGTPVMERASDAPAAAYVREGLNRTGAANIVTAVILDFRGYDTLGEATVLFCAIAGALAVLRRRARKAKADPDTEEESA